MLALKYILSIVLLYFQFTEFYCKQFTDIFQKFKNILALYWRNSLTFHVFMEVAHNTSLYSLSVSTTRRHPEVFYKQDFNHFALASFQLRCSPDCAVTY